MASFNLAVSPSSSQSSSKETNEKKSLSKKAEAAAKKMDDFVKGGKGFAINLAMLQRDDASNPLHGHSFGDKTEALLKEGSSDVAIFKQDYEPPEVNGVLLDREIEEILRDFEPSEDLSIPQRLVAAASEKNSAGDSVYTELSRLKEVATNLVSSQDGIILPGGPSIEPKFYGETYSSEESRSGYYATPQRSILEFCLIQACRTQGKPIMGICRGHQVINVFFGGSLNRTSLGDHQSAVVRNTREDGSGKYIDIPDRVFFNHKQLVTRPGKGLDSLGGLDTTGDFETQSVKLTAGLEADRGTISVPREEYLTTVLGEDAIDFMSPEDCAAFLMTWDEAHERVHNTESAVEKLKQNLELLMSKAAVIAVEGGPRSPLIGVQFHPEKVVDRDTMTESMNRKRNKNIFLRFISMALVSKQKDQVLDDLKTHKFTSLKL